MSITPVLKAVIVESKTIPGEFSLRVIKDAKQVPIQMSLKDAGFVPGDIVRIGLIEEWNDLEAELAAKDDLDDLQFVVDDLESRIHRAIQELES